jgi:5-methylcytosine-specific restriction enzyme A
LIEGRTVTANVVNHIRPHRGDWNLFRDPDNLQSLCKFHHDSEAQSQDVRGYGSRIGENGWPLDTRHPASVTIGEVRYIQPMFKPPRMKKDKKLS